MRIARFAVRSINDVVSRRFLRPPVARLLSTNASFGNRMNGDQNSNSFESADEFERRIFGDSHGSGSASWDAFYQKLDSLRERSGLRMGGGSESETDDVDEDFDDTLSDGMDGELKRAATEFEYDSEEVEEDGYKFRPDVTFLPGMTYTIKDLDLTKPGVRKPVKRHEFEVTTEEVLRKADFRNVRFLANFITEAGIIIKRSKTGISAKAQRRVAREIKTARAFGLMPFTTMGTKSFAFGKTMEDLDRDYEYESLDSRMDDDLDEKARL